MHPRRGGWVLSKWETLLWHLNMPPPLPFCLLTEEQRSERGGVIRGRRAFDTLVNLLLAEPLNIFHIMDGISKMNFKELTVVQSGDDQSFLFAIGTNTSLAYQAFLRCKTISRSSQSSCSRETINRLHLPYACPSIQRINHPITVGPSSWAFHSKLPNCRARLHWTCLKLISVALCQASLLSTELHLIVLHFTST